MSPKTILSRWVAIEQGDEIRRIRRVSRNLSLAAYMIFFAALAICAYFQPPAWIALFPGLVVGWLIAEKNALDTRIAHWPVFRRYIDWARVEADLQAAPDESN